MTETRKGLAERVFKLEVRVAQLEGMHAPSDVAYVTARSGKHFQQGTVLTSANDGPVTSRMEHPPVLTYRDPNQGRTIGRVYSPVRHAHALVVGVLSSWVNDGSLAFQHGGQQLIDTLREVRDLLELEEGTHDEGTTGRR